MPVDGMNTSNPEIECNLQNLKRRSVLSSSNPTSDELPIDCILVYEWLNSQEESELENDPEEPERKHRKPSERRKKFEEYLSIKQRLVLERIVSRTREAFCFSIRICSLQRNRNHKKRWDL